MMDDNDRSGFFNHVDDLMEFPSDNNHLGGCKDFPSIWDEALPAAYRIAASDLSAELSVPYEDIIHLEWLSTFVEDSFSGGGMTLTKDYSSVIKIDTSQNQFHTSSPVSVLESSSTSSSCSSSSGVKLSPLIPIHHCPQRARSKRPRPATFIPRPIMQFISPTSSFRDTSSPSVSSKAMSFAEPEHPATKFLEPHGIEQQKKKIKLKPHSVAVRKCMHCEITETPQWRAGPMGPKTLCNACGVRYKSGRLFPEYRPAASPTFSPSLHSNSHKKVVQMRCNVVENEPVTFKKNLR